jgi:hypothetical protein
MPSAPWVTEFSGDVTAMAFKEPKLQTDGNEEKT